MVNGKSTSNIKKELLLDVIRFIIFILVVIIFLPFICFVIKAYWFMGTETLKTIFGIMIELLLQLWTSKG